MPDLDLKIRLSWNWIQLKDKSIITLFIKQNLYVLKTIKPNL